MSGSAPASPSDSSRAEARSDHHPLHPSALEIASGRMYGEYQQSVGLGDSEVRRLTPLAALEEVVLPALQRPPCLVSFSGGRDSSAVLAAATSAARREGLPPPVPITLRVPSALIIEEAPFRAPNAMIAGESAWQEHVVRYLGLREWEVREAGDEVDCLGRRSTAVLRRHGVLYPSNAFLQVPLLEAARGGPLLTGFGGDEIFGLWRWGHHGDLLARRKRPTSRDLLRLAYAALPKEVRRRREHRVWHWGGDLTWLRPEATRVAAELAFGASADQPRFWPRWLHWLMRRRTLCAARWSYSLLAEDAGTSLFHPLLDPTFLSALTKAGGRFGLGDRTTAMRAIFADVLPDAVLSRPTKANYERAFWGQRSREFARGWDGRSVDAELVDPDALRREWLKRAPHRGSAMLLYSAWLSEQR